MGAQGMKGTAMLSLGSTGRPLKEVSCLDSQELEKEKEKKRQSNSSSCNIGGFTMERSLLQSLSLLSHPFHRDAINLSSNGLAVISFLSFCARPLKMEGNCLAMRRKDRQAVLHCLGIAEKLRMSQACDSKLLFT